MELRSNEVSWVRTYRPGEEISLNKVKHLHQEIENLSGHREVKEIGALTDGEPIDEFNAQELIKVFNDHRPKPMPPVKHYPTYQNVESRHRRDQSVSGSMNIFPMKSHVAPIPQQFHNTTRYSLDTRIVR